MSDAKAKTVNLFKESFLVKVHKGTIGRVHNLQRLLLQAPSRGMNVKTQECLVITKYQSNS